jgi:Flp pilus assembly protein TadB
MTNQYLSYLPTGRKPDLRASDAEREETAERLRTSHAEGRLDLAEFQERLGRCYQAKTGGELSEIVSDLPRDDEPRRVGSPRRGRPLLLVAVLIALVVLSSLGGHHGHGPHVFWVWVPLLFIFWRVTWWRHRRREPARGLR